MIDAASLRRFAPDKNDDADWWRADLRERSVIPFIPDTCGS